MRRLALRPILPLVALLAGCRPTAAPPKPPPPLVFEEVTAASGLRFTHNTGAFGRKWMPETMGAGCALVDVNGDGRLDVFLVDGTAWPGRPGRPGRSRLYLNRGDWRFEDATERWGVPPGLYGMGVGAGDCDNDGDPDLLITALGGSRLLVNEGGRRFRDATAGSGIATPGWPTSALWLDYDRDGLLDLFICHYVRWTPATDRFATLDGVNKTYARPDAYPGEPCRLFRNLGGLRFRDVSREAGVDLPRSKALGVALCEVLDRDGWPDLAVSNDTVPNFLFRNQTDGQFKELAQHTGMAVAEAGQAKAGMGIDTGDYENRGQDAVLITNFAGEQLSLYRRDESGLFQDVAARAGIGAPSQRFLGFGAFFFDADLDGFLDVLVANGHIQPDVAVRSSEVTHAQPGLLFRGTPGGVFQDLSATAGALAIPRVARGAAYGDLDGDGDLDVLLTTNGGPPALLRLAGRPAAGWVRLRLEGRRSNRSAIGATITVRGGGLTQTRMVRGGSSYLSHSQLALTFGLGVGGRADEVEVRWPAGQVESFGPLTPGREHHLVEGMDSGQGPSAGR
jgi:hypothetical protein